MANTLAPFGFSQYQGTGSLPTYEQTQMAVASGNSTAIFFGDPVVQLSTGYIAQATAPQALAISGFALSNGLVTATFTSTTIPAVGATLVLQGLTTATTLNGAWLIVASTATTAVFAYSGGAVTTQATTGYVFTPVSGIFVGCKYISVAQKKPVWGNYWPGSDANGDVTAYVVNDPNAQFIVQTANSNTTATALGLSAIGQNIGFSIGAGNTANGISAAYADQYTLQANFPTGNYGQPYMPFRIIALANYVPGSTTSLAAQPLGSIPGNDFTSAYNKVVVGFNNAMLKQLSGI
jgi:hypothetical protein